MEFVIVRYPSSRPVFMDGQDAGVTSRMLFVEEGHHVFDLGEPGDYEPPEFERVVTGTSAVAPLELAFVPRSPAAGGPA
jgi:hypothetical protein